MPAPSVSPERQAVDARADAEAALVAAALPSAYPSLSEYREAISRVRLDWYYAVSIVVVHALALFALVPWLFSWTGVALLIAGIYFYGGVGINMCYHRLLTHRSFKCPQWLERFLVLVAACCLEDSPGRWVATHRLHHNESDQPPDPHTPKVNFWWSHVGWLMVKNPDVQCIATYEKYARDILMQPFYLQMERRLLWFWIYVAHALGYFGVGLAAGAIMTGTLMGGVQFGLSLLVWGVILRTVCVWHITWSVNSLSHMFGYRNYETGEDSRNNWFVAFITSGEGWHNNHHGDPASASNGHRWWEIDLIYLWIKGLELVGLAWDVNPPMHKRRRAAVRPS